MSALRLPQIDETRASRALYAVCILAVAAGAVLAIWKWATSPAYWTDELFSLVVARGLLEAPGATMAGLVLPDVHPPLYYFLLAGWVWLFGDGELVARGLSLLGGLGALGVLWWMGRPMLSRPALALALLWLATHWFWAIHGAEARMYGLLICGGAWVSLAFARLWTAGRVPDPRSLWLLCLGGLPLALLHYSGMALFCSALLLLLLRHRNHRGLWLPALAAVLVCLAWTAYHLPQVLGGGWVSRALGEGRPILALPKALSLFFFPQYPYWGSWLPGMRAVPVWAALSSLYALVAWIWWRQIREAGGWKRWRAGLDAGDGAFLRSQLALLGAFSVVIASAHLWKPILVHKMLLAALVPMAACVGCLGAHIFRRGYLALAGVSLALAAVSVAATFQSLEWRWFLGSPNDRPGVREIAAREAEGASGVRVFFYYEEDSDFMLSGGAYGLALLGGVSAELLRPAAIRPHLIWEDMRHFAPPFYLANVFPARGDFFRRRGLQAELLPVQGQKAPGARRPRASFLVTEPAQ